MVEGSKYLSKKYFLFQFLGFFSQNYKLAKLTGPHYSQNLGLENPKYVFFVPLLLKFHKIKTNNTYTWKF